MLFRRLIICVLLTSAAIVHAEAGRMAVFVSIPPQKFVVDNIGGKYVQAKVMLAPGQSPETFDPSSKKIESLSGAEIYFLIGVPFERTWSKTLQDVNPDIKMVKCYSEEEDEWRHSGDYDPHIWTSPSNMKKIAEMIKDALIDKDPERKSYYENNYNHLISKLDTLDDYIRTTLAERRTDYFIVSHAAWTFYAREYGLKQIALESSGRETGPKSLARILNIVKEQNIHTLFVQEQYQTPVAQALAAEMNGSIKMLDPLAENYIENMMKVTDEIAEAVK